MNVPYDTGKVKIGINYQPKPYVEIDRDMLLLQSCLLHKTNVFSWLRDILRGLTS